MKLHRIGSSLQRRERERELRKRELGRGYVQALSQPQDLLVRGLIGKQMPTDVLPAHECLAAV